MEVNERCQCKLTLTFYDENNVLLIPTTLSYNIKDVYSDTTVKTVTTVSPSSSSYAITITSADNRILDNTLTVEKRKVTCQWYSGTTLVGTEDYEYDLINKFYVLLSAVSASPSVSPSISPSISPSVSPGA
jgi:hypothetical protein